MTDNELTAKILNLAGYEVIFHERTFTILREGVKSLSGSSELTPKKAIQFIIERSLYEGKNIGKKELRKDFRTLLGL